MTPLRALIAPAEVVATTMPSATVVVQAVCGLGIHASTGVPSGCSTALRLASSRGIATSTTQMRQAPSGGSLACEQKIGMWTSARRAASVIRVPAGTSIGRPSMVTRQVVLTPTPPPAPRRAAG